jgi:hypothetical protein
VAVIIEQSSNGSGGGSNTFTMSLNFSSTPTVGNLVVLCCDIRREHGDPESYSASDNQGNTYTLKQSVGLNNGTRGKVCIFTAPIATASGTFSVTFGTTGESWDEGVLQGSISEVSGHNASSPFDQQGSGYGTTSPATVDTADQQSTTLIFAAARQEWLVSLTPATGWSSIRAENLFNSCYRTGTYEPSWTLGMGNDWGAVAVGIAVGASASGNPWYYYAHMAQKIKDKWRNLIRIPGFDEIMAFQRSLKGAR